MKNWSAYKTATGALKAKFGVRAGYIFTALRNDDARLAYLATIFPIMSSAERSKLLYYLRKKWDMAMVLQQLWDSKHPQRHRQSRT